MTCVKNAYLESRIVLQFRIGFLTIFLFSPFHKVTGVKYLTFLFLSFPTYEMVLMPIELAGICHPKVLL